MIRIHLLRSLFKNELSLGNSKTCTSDEMLLLKLKLAEFSSQQQSFRHSNEIHTSWRGNAENIHEHENAIPLQQQQHEALIVQKSYDGEFSLDFLSTFLLVKLFLNLNVKKLINNANGISRWKETKWKMQWIRFMFIRRKRWSEVKSNLLKFLSWEFVDCRF